MYVRQQKKIRLLAKQKYVKRLRCTQKFFRKMGKGGGKGLTQGQSRKNLKKKLKILE